MSDVDPKLDILDKSFCKNIVRNIVRNIATKLVDSQMKNEGSASRGELDKHHNHKENYIFHHYM